MSSLARWWASQNSNVQLNFAYSALANVAQSLMAGSSTMAAYVYFLEGAKNSADDVGFVSATSGVVMVVLSLPIGWLTDKMRRDRMLRYSAVLGLLTSAVLSVALALDSMPALYAASACNGAFAAVNGPALAALFADSIPTGGRTAVYTANYAVTLASGGLGPLIALLIMLGLGNEWRTPQLRAVMWTGNVLNALSCLLLPFFDDDKALGERSEGVLARGEGAGGRQDEGGAHGLAVPLLLDPGTATVGGAGGATQVSPVGDKEGAAGAQQSSTMNLGHQAFRVMPCCTLRVRHIPWIIFVSDFAIAIGAGMTVQYFALYFANDYGLQPVEVSAIYTASPLLIAILSGAASSLSRHLGRAATAVLCDAVGTACLFGLWAKLPLAGAVPLYLLRTAAMNASYPLQRAILMDVVPKNQRGLWNSLEGLTAFTWTGSAALGGLLIDRYGYGYTFFITGSIYTVATAMLLTLVPLTAGEVVVLPGAGPKEEVEGGGGAGLRKGALTPDSRQAPCSIPARILPASPRARTHSIE